MSQVEGCHGRCRRADQWHEVAAIEAEVLEGRAFAEGYLEGFLAALGPVGRSQAGYRAARYEERCAEMEAARQRVRARNQRSPGWPDEFPGGWPLPPTYVDPDAPPMRCSRDGWPIPPQLLGGAA